MTKKGKLKPSIAGAAGAWRRSAPSNILARLGVPMLTPSGADNITAAPAVLAEALGRSFAEEIPSAEPLSQKYHLA